MANDLRKRPVGDAGRCTKTSSKKRYSRKRKYHGKTPRAKPTTVNDIEVVEDGNRAVESDTLQPSDIDLVQTDDQQPEIPLDHTITKIIDIEIPGKELKKRHPHHLASVSLIY